jgi:hypothetical protein
MKQRIPLFENFEPLNEMPMGYPQTKMRSVRSVGAVVKELQKSKYYNPADLYRIQWNGLSMYAQQQYTPGEKEWAYELVKLVYTDGQWPMGKSRDTLDRKASELWTAVKKADAKIEQMIQQEYDREQAEKAEKKRIEDEKKHKAEIAQAAKELKFMEDLGIDGLFKYAKRYAWYVKINPWSCPKANFNKGNSVPMSEMQPGQLYIGDGTIYSAGLGKGIMFPAIFKFVKTKENNTCVIEHIMSMGMYGPSVWVSLQIDGKESNARVSGEPLEEFLKKNKSQIESINKKYDDIWEKEKDEEALPFDPYWGMN